MKRKKFNSFNLSVFFIITLSITCLFIVSSIASSEKTPPLLFRIGLHIEPFSSVTSELSGSKQEPKTGKNGKIIFLPEGKYGFRQKVNNEYS